MGVSKGLRSECEAVNSKFRVTDPLPPISTTASSNPHPLSTNSLPGPLLASPILLACLSFLSVFRA